MSTSFDPRITAYFGDAVLRAGFVAVPHLLLRHYHQLGLSANQAMFVLQLMESTWDLAEPPSTTGELARRMGVDKRTIRRYSEEIAALGLLGLFDQFDEHGAQIGNGYDLSPLFGRLAELAPEPERGSDPTRKPRPARGNNVEGEIVRPTPGQNRPPHPRTKSSAPPPDKIVRPGEDTAIRGPGTARSALNGISRNSKNQQEELLSAADVAHKQQPAGYSLNLGRALAADEVAGSHGVLARMGIEQPVRGIIAPSLAPAEAWALCALARARRWNAGLVIAQAYDRTTRSARAVEDVPPALRALGSALAALAPEEADAALGAIINALGGAKPSRDGLPAALHDAVDGAWPVLERLAGHRPTTAPAGSPEQAVTTDAASRQLWLRVQAELACSVPPAEFDTWLRGATLLALGEHDATIGAGNTFVRDELDGTYRPLLTAALRGAVGRELSVAVVIA